MKNLLTTMAILETLVGVLLLAAPSLVASKLLGAESLDANAQTIARIAGAALTTLGFACWHYRYSVHAKPLVLAMTFYNIAVPVVLAYGRFALDLKAPELIPPIFFHLAIGVWCIVALRAKSSPSAT